MQMTSQPIYRTREQIQQLVQAFEACTLPPDQFNHHAHMTVALWYLAQLPLDQATDKMRTAIQRFAAFHHQAQLYNETITCAYLFLIRERMAHCEAANWEEFANQNSDLLIWKGGVLATLYRQETLDSDLARHTFVLPDQCL